MYKHVVMWRLKDESDGMNKAQLVEEVMSRLNSLPAIISELKDFEVASNIGDYGATFYDISLIATYENEEDFKKYCVYPEHDAVVAYIQSVQTDEIIVDYEL